MTTKIICPYCGNVTPLHVWRNNHCPVCNFEVPGNFSPLRGESKNVTVKYVWTSFPNTSPTTLAVRIQTIHFVDDNTRRITFRLIQGVVEEVQFECVLPTVICSDWLVGQKMELLWNAPIGA